MAQFRSALLLFPITALTDGHSKSCVTMIAHTSQLIITCRSYPLTVTNTRARHHGITLPSPAVVPSWLWAFRKIVTSIGSFSKHFSFHLVCFQKPVQSAQPDMGYRQTRPRSIKLHSFACQWSARHQKIIERSPGFGHRQLFDCKPCRRWRVDWEILLGISARA